MVEADKRGLKVPNLRAVAAAGSYATGVRGVCRRSPIRTTRRSSPAPRRPRTGSRPTSPSNPLRKNQEGWYWYASDIKLPTFGTPSTVRTGRSRASIGRRASAQGRSTSTFRKYWRARNQEDLKLVRALSTRGLIEDLEHALGEPFAATFGEDPAFDEARSRFAGELIELKHPAFMTLHLVSLDHTEHTYGPGTPEANAALERIDGAVGALLTQARNAEPDLIVAVVSDHGFAPVSSDVNLMVPFIEAGSFRSIRRRRRSRPGRPSRGQPAAPRRSFSHIRRIRRSSPRVGKLLATLSADPALGIAKVIARPEIVAQGAAAEASFYIDFKFGYDAGRNLTGPVVTPSTQKGTHGYFPDHKEMRATFLIAGPGVPKKGSLGDIDMRAIAPTLARLMNVPLSTAQAKPLF